MIWNRRWGGGQLATVAVVATATAAAAGMLPGATQVTEQATDQTDPTTEMLWGGPWVAWRWDRITSDIRLMSIREIAPGQRLHSPA